MPIEFQHAGPRLQQQAAHSLADGEVHVWHLNLDVSGPSLDNFYRLLSFDERERAIEFVFERDRRRFVAARGLLRTVLAAYTAASPAELCFQYGTHGKPALAASTHLTFNLSHTQNSALLAISRGRNIGIDIEWIRPAIDILGIARSTFAATEQQRLAALPIDRQLAGFYACWTRKEAYIKARGDGLSYPLDAFEVSLTPDLPPALLWSAEGSEEIQRWEFVPIDAPAGCAAALVVEAPVNCIRIARLPRDNCHPCSV